MRIKAAALLTVSLACAACGVGPSKGSADGTGQGPLTLSNLAGDYYYGDGLGVNCNLRVRSSGRFSFVWTGCLGTYGQNEGTASLKDGYLLLSSSGPNVEHGFGGTPTTFLPVRWGARMYLIPKSDVVEFVNEISQGHEPRERIHGSFYLRKGDWKKPADGQPDLPEEWRVGPCRPTK